MIRQRKCRRVNETGGVANRLRNARNQALLQFQPQPQPYPDPRAYHNSFQYAQRPQNTCDGRGHQRQTGVVYVPVYQAPVDPKSRRGTKSKSRRGTNCGASGGRDGRIAVNPKIDMVRTSYSIAKYQPS